MGNLHEHYDKLTNRGREIVDEAFLTIIGENVTASGNVDAERLVDALAKFIIDSGNTLLVLAHCDTCDDSGFVNTNPDANDPVIMACGDCERGSRT